MVRVLKDFWLGLGVVLAASGVALVLILLSEAGRWALDRLAENGLLVFRIGFVILAIVCTWALGVMLRRRR